MQINVANPILQTVLFAVIFGLVLLLSAKSSSKKESFGLELTSELKGFAILAIMFSHIGYFLSTDDHFLFPLSILAGVAVNIFLFLSGFGLTMSQTLKPLNVWQFYKKRLINLFLPFLIVITSFFILDFFLLHKTYSGLTVIQSYLGFFPKANLYESLNAPLWYFTLILFYYLIFPVIYIKKYPYISALILILISWLVLHNVSLPVDIGVWSLYQIHFLAFPLGMLFAQVIQRNFKISFRYRYLLILILLTIFIYLSFNTGVGESKELEQLDSLVTLFLAIIIFMLKPVDFKLFYIFGVYSYEIYLLHWPLMYRYDLVYKFLPPFLATVVYLILFLVLGWVLQWFLTSAKKLLRI